MDLANVIRYYIDKMLKDVRGMKVLLLDADTTRIVSLVYSQTEILDQEVYLVEKLDSDRTERLEHLKVSCLTCPARADLPERIAACSSYSLEAYASTTMRFVVHQRSFP